MFRNISAHFSTSTLDAIALINFQATPFVVSPSEFLLRATAPPSSSTHQVETANGPTSHERVSISGIHILNGVYFELLALLLST